MNLLNPAAITLGILALPIILLYMLKLRRREVEISSTMLWQMLQRDRQANAPWQKLKRNLLLFLQLLILSALVFALARPTLPIPNITSGSVVVLLDASASMNATDLSPSRFEVARMATRNLIDGLGNDSYVTLVLVKDHPVTLVSMESDKTILHRTLDSATASQGSANWGAAFALAAGASGSGNASISPVDIVIISDGSLPRQGLPPLPGEVRYIPLGESSDNLAISALALRTMDKRAELFCRVTNYGDIDRTAILSFYRDGELFSAQQVHIPAGDSSAITLTDLPKAQAIFRAHLSNPDRTDRPPDVFSLDDVAFAVGYPQRAGRTLLISTGNFFIEQVLAALPEITPYRAIADAGGEIPLSDDPFDLYIFDGISPPTESLPNGNLMFINPQPNPFFSVTGVFTTTRNVLVADHPLTRYIDWTNVHISRAKSVQLPVWAEALIQTDRGPLIFVGETQGRRLAVITFDIHDSDLPLQVTFPILFSNLIDYLIPTQAFDAPYGLQPGENLSIPPDPDVAQVIIASPTGQLHSYPVSENGILFSETGELGVYGVNFMTETGQRSDFFAVNLFNENESDIRPVESIHVGRENIVASDEAEVGQRELWPWLAAAALTVLLLEWLIYHRRHGLIIDRRIYASWLKRWKEKTSP